MTSTKSLVSDKKHYQNIILITNIYNSDIIYLYILKVIMNNKFIKLTNRNYLDLQKSIEKINPEYYTSAQYLLLWKTYGASIYFNETIDAIYLYAKYESSKIEIRVDDFDKDSDFIILKPITRNEENSYQYLKRAIELVKDEIASRNNIYIGRLWKHDLKWFENYEVIREIESSYIYTKDQLTYFAGKKMQKKRNLYNFYKNHYSNETKLIKYEPKYINDVLEYCKSHMTRNGQPFREHEYNWIKELLLDSRLRLYGSIMYYQDKMVGVTVGCIHNNIYEIFVEKADKNLKGSYQYLLSENLKLYRFDGVEFIDRQDSESEVGLIQSKRSYKPIKIIKTYIIRIKK